MVHYDTTNSMSKYCVVSLCILVLLFFIVQPVYAQLGGINIVAELGGEPIGEGALISPSASNPLEFFLSSSTSFSSYTCKIIKVDDDLFNNILDGIFNPNENNLIGTEVSSDLCGSGTDASIEYAQTFADGTYVFQAIGLTGEGVAAKSVFAFEALGGQAAAGGSGALTAAGEVLANVEDFWQECKPVTGPGADQSAISKAIYEIEGEVKLKNIDFTSNKKLKLEITTNKLNDKIYGTVSSGSDREDFKVKSVDTKCFNDLPETAGGLPFTGPGKAFSIKTLKAWNPPVPKCDPNTKFYLRDITYFFEVEDRFNDLKKTSTKDVEFRLIVDHIPKDPDDLTVHTQLLLGKDKDKEVKIEISSKPSVRCSGEILIQ